MAVITLIMTCIFFVMTVLSCITDVKSLRIPNWHSLVIILSFIPAWLATPALFDGLWMHVGGMGVMFITTYCMFCLGMMGGGDSKLGTAVGLWVGLKGFLPFLLYMALIGGLLGLITIVLRRKKLFKNPAAGSWIKQAQDGRSAVPYGVAISIGAWAALFHTGFLYNQLNEVFKIIH